MGPLGKHAVLLLSSLYLLLDFLGQWRSFKGCPRPIHKWMAGSYLMVFFSRLVVMAAMRYGDTRAMRAFATLREKSTWISRLAASWWIFLTPFLLIWSAMGTYWIWQVYKIAPRYLPGGLHLATMMLWQVLSYAWAFVYCLIGAMSCAAHWRMRNAERDFSTLQDDDMVQRWGQFGEFQARATLGSQGKKGLAANDIRALPGLMTLGSDVGDFHCEGEDCPICLNAFERNEVVRRLPACGHTFHRSCVDVWLFRSAECPLCKQKVAEKEA